MNMEDFDEDPLDLLEDDGDGVIEMGLFFDDDKKGNDSGSEPPGNSGCCVVILGMGASLLITGWGVAKWIA
jgi:hypothetical protein